MIWYFILKMLDLWQWLIKQRHIYIGIQYYLHIRKVHRVWNYTLWGKGLSLDFDCDRITSCLYTYQITPKKRPRSVLFMNRFVPFPLRFVYSQNFCSVPNTFRSVPKAFRSVPNTFLSVPKAFRSVPKTFVPSPKCFVPSPKVSFCPQSVSFCPQSVLFHFHHIKWFRTKTNSIYARCFN